MLSTLVSAVEVESYIQERRAQMVESNLFYKSLTKMFKPEDYQWCVNLYKLSKEFVEVLRVRHERFLQVPHDVFYEHYQEEVGHAQMLRHWMIGQGLPDPEYGKVTFETEDFISTLYRVAFVMNEDMTLLLINSTAEGFACDLYQNSLAQLCKAGIPDSTNYWALHAEADEEHSNVASLIAEMSEDEAQEAYHYVSLTLDKIDRMIKSWAN